MQLTHLGPYEIGRPLGKGGMGSVFAAIDTQTGARVAIKALTPHLATAEGFRERFDAEIESLKTLRHEGIVRLYGYGEQDGVLFYSMELVDGISLEDELKAGRRFNWREVSSIAIQLSLALKHAHDHGIVHRDIKPANILLYDEDRVKLADFGIARLFGTTQLTHAGGVLGTADYMSPEQADGRPVTVRCDQYSLGGVMYALLTGRPPFRAKNLPQMLQLQRFAKPEPVRRYAGDTPEQLERVIMQLLAKNPADRFPNMQVLARHLQAMVRALSRPSHDDFALGSEQPAVAPHDAGMDHSLAFEATRSEAENVDANPSLANDEFVKQDAIVASKDAATLAADEGLHDERAVGKEGALVPATGGAGTHPGDRPTRFTTLEEEEARRRAEHQRSWIAVVAQLGGLAAVLAAMGALAVYVSRPLSADKLYQSISRVETDEVAIRNVESEIDEFLTRYPNDPRAGELQRYKEQIELDKLERRLHREAGGRAGGDSSMLPVERLYLQAVEIMGNAPEEAETMLKSLVALYGPNAADEPDPQSLAVVQLAKRRLATLQAELPEQRQRRLEALRERLNVAERLSKNDPSRAAAMYRAIIRLHEQDRWMEEAVEVARSRLAELEKKTQ